MLTHPGHTCFAKASHIFHLFCQSDLAFLSLYIQLFFSLSLSEMRRYLCSFSHFFVVFLSLPSSRQGMLKSLFLSFFLSLNKTLFHSKLTFLFFLLVPLTLLCSLSLTHTNSTQSLSLFLPKYLFLYFFCYSSFSWLKFLFGRRIIFWTIDGAVVVVVIVAVAETLFYLI